MIFITGASSGFGLACAEAFAAEGKPLLLVARRLDRLKKLADSLKTKHNVEVQTFALDVRDRAAVSRFAETNDKLLAQVTVLVNNAGLAKGLSSIQEGNLDDWETMIDTNVKGLLFVTRAVLPHFVKRKSGHVVNIGSIAGRWSYPNGNVYSATKRAVGALTESMRIDLHGTGVRVTEIAPGMANTEFSLVRLGDQSRADAVYAGTESLTAEDIADAVVWCTSRPARVNIQELVIYPTGQAAPGMVTRSTNSR